MTRKKQIISKEKCRRLWVSFGVFITVLPFLDGYQITSMQTINMFWYKIAVSRVQYTIKIKRPFYLLHPDFDEIVSIDGVTGQSTIIKDYRLDFAYILSVQVKQDLYCIFCQEDRFVHLSNLKSYNFNSSE